MPKISSAFKSYAEKWLKGVESIADPNQALGTARADATLIDDQASEVRHGKHRLICDEPQAVGGTDQGPTPLDYFMASIGFCQNVTFARYATLNGVEFDSLTTTVRGHWDRRGQANPSDIEPAFRDFVVETRIISKGSVGEIRKVARIAHRRCPMHATISKAGRVVDKLYVNDVEVPY